MRARSQSATAAISGPRPIPRTGASGTQASVRRAAAGALVGITLLLVAGCTGGQPKRSSSSPVSGKHVSVLTTWVGPELDAFRSVVAPFEAQTGIVVDDTTTTDLRGELRRRIAFGEPPDVSGLVGPGHMADLARAGLLRDLSGALDIATYRQQTAPAFVSLGMVDDRLVGAFLRATLKGLVWYDPRSNHLGTPDSWDDLQRTALRFSTEATRPWCVGLESGSASGWPGTDWVESILLRQSGRKVYDQWVAGALPWTSTEVRSAFSAYLEVVSDDAVAGGAAGALQTDFRSAAEGPFGKPPACLYTQGASFTPAFLEAADREPGRDYDFFPLPAHDPRNAGSMEVAGDMFGLFSDRPEAAQLMAWLVGTEAQRIWVEEGTALSGNLGVSAYPDVVTRREAQLLASATDVRFDASDQMDTKVSAAFLAAVLQVTADPSRLDTVLSRLDQIRSAPQGRTS